MRCAGGQGAESLSPLGALIRQHPDQTGRVALRLEELDPAVPAGRWTASSPRKRVTLLA